MNAVLPGFDPGARPRVRLIALPCAGRGAAQYTPWRRRMPRDVQLVPVQLPGREGRVGEEPATDLVGLAAALSRALVPLLDTPFALFGHSMGALVGFELARAVRANFGIEPVHLVVAASPSPQYESGGVPTTVEIGARVAAGLSGVDGPERDEALARGIRVLAADTEMCRSYAFAPAAPFDCPVTAIRGQSDTGVTADLMTPWSAHTTASFTLTEVAGDHFLADSWDTLPELVAGRLRSLHV